VVTVVVWLSVLVGVAMAVGVVVAVLVGIALRQTFPKSNISVSKPAIVVPFGRKGCESLDIIPGSSPKSSVKALLGQRRA